MRKKVIISLLTLILSVGACGEVVNMANKYCNLQGTQKISESYNNINVGFDGVELDINNHVNGTANRHSAQHITYSGSVAGASNVKEGLDNLKNRVEQIITTPIDGEAAAQELVDARGGKPTLGARLSEIDASLADYEYQTPTIVGTQIQLEKQSNTNILKFKLDTDLSGGAITISLDEGSTEKPLVDVEGVAVTELSKGFVEVVENSINFTYVPKGGASLSEFNAHLADYEYQIPTIVGTQIQLQKQSDTNILKFKLDSDLSGGAITISLDGGSTSKPLKDIDGNAVTELSKGFVEVIEDVVNFTYAPKGGASLKEANEIIFSAESIGYGGDIRSITSDDNYLYVGGTTTRKVYKLNKSDLSKVAESIGYGGDILSITSDDNYLYVGGVTTQKVYKLNKSDLSKVAESIDYGGNIYSIPSDDNYLYVGGATTQKVYKLNKSDLSKVAESIDYGGSIYSIASDDNYLYVGGTTTRKVYKLNKSDLSKVAESIDYGGSIYSIASDDNYLYVGGTTTRKVYKLNKSDLSKVAESIDYGGSIYSIASDDNYLYVGGTTTRKVYKLNKSDLSKVAESIDYGGDIRSITSDNNYLYVGGVTTQKVYKLSKVAYLYKNLKLVVIGSV